MQPTTYHLPVENLNLPNSTARGVAKISINLSPPQNRYFPGQLVRGTVDIAFCEHLQINAISITWKCEVRCEIPRGSPTETQTEVLIHNTQQLEGKTTMRPSIYQYPFGFFVPEEYKYKPIPSFFIGNHGSVLWTLGAVLEPANTYSYNSTSTILVPVLTFNDINQAKYEKPNYVIRQRNLCCLCCRTGPITVHLQIPRLGFAPGDKLPFQLMISNSSSRRITSEISLVRHVVYKANSREKSYRYKQYKDEEREEIATRSRTSSFDKIQPGGTYTWPLNESFFIVPIDAEASFSTRILEFGYLLLVKVNIPAGDVFKIELPVVIGSETAMESVAGDFGFVV